MPTAPSRITTISSANAAHVSSCAKMMRTSLALNGASGDPAGSVSTDPTKPGEKIPCERMPDGVEIDGVAGMDENGETPGFGNVVGVPEVGVCADAGDIVFASMEI